MKIGVPREVKDNENRVGMVPSGVHEITEAGHEVIVEKDAGFGSGFSDDEYIDAGAKIIPDADTVWSEAEMIVKVKEPIEVEFERMQEGQALFTYLHLAPLPELTDKLLERNVAGIAYETITGKGGSLPLLTPMSEVAGRMSIQVGAFYLQRPNGGRGVLLGGVPGVPPIEVAIIGGGIVGINAAKMAIGLGAKVTILDTNLDRLRYLDDVFRGRLQTVASNKLHIDEACERCDLLVGAVLIPGASAPKLVTRDTIGKMKKGSVAVDVAVDQGGCFETTKATTHSDPIYEVDEVIHYCVANMPGAVPRTSTIALTNATLPYVRKLANQGVVEAIRADAGLAEGVNTWAGHVTYQAVAESLGKEYKPLDTLL
ncbi:MAG: alanine dehydrogenase [Thermoanaerobaculia bacterium]|nr:alanine dehydrogenase [Thermoanaerobaculia bacterium]